MLGTHATAARSLIYISSGERRSAGERLRANSAQACESTGDWGRIAFGDSMRSGDAGTVMSWSGARKHKCQIVRKITATPTAAPREANTTVVDAPPSAVEGGGGGDAPPLPPPLPPLPPLLAMALATSPLPASYALRKAQIIWTFADETVPWPTPGIST